MRIQPLHSSQATRGSERASRARTLARGPALAPALALALLALASGTIRAARGAGINAPVGPYINLRAEAFAAASSFGATNRLLLTPYFYWYDVYSGAHLANPDGSDALTDHPPTLTGFSYRSSAWHAAQMRDMIDAGIDVLLPVYWGEPSQRVPDKPVAAQPWSYAGIPPLVAAREDLEAQGLRPPRIGMFYDTSTLQFNAANERIDLTTPRGRQWFYESVRDFFSLVPPRHWAMIDGRPVVFLYAAGFAARHDQTCLDELRASFARDFGGRTPYVVREVSWNLRADQVYAWGGALGLRNPGVASLGPGYDHSAVPGRTPLVVPREGGAFFARNWETFLRRPSLLAMIETWNEFHEGTDIARSKEHGRAYIELNRRYADPFHAGLVLPRLPGPFTGARLLSIDLGATNREAGLVQFESADGATVATNLGALECRTVGPTAYAGHFVYFKVDESFKWADTMDVQAVVDYFDAVRGTLRLQFDGSDPGAPFQGTYSAAPETVALSGSRSWRTAVFTLAGARFLNLQNGGADFRIESSALGVGLRRVQFVRPGLKPQSFRPSAGCQLLLFAAPGAGYAIDASTDLIRWTELLRGRAADTVTPFLDTAAADSAARWYRARRR